MRKGIKIFLVITLVLFFSKSYAQMDTIKYLKQFEINKHHYIGKPFSKLLKKMLLKPQVFNVWSEWGSCYKASDFGFSDKNKFVSMVIVWEGCYISNPEFGMDNFISAQKITREDDAKLKNKKIRNIFVFDYPGLGFFREPHSGRKNKPLDTYQFLANSQNQYSGLRFEDFLCKTRISVGVQKFKNIIVKNKIYSTVFTMRSYKISSGEEDKDVILEIEWEKSIKADLFILNEGKLRLGEIKIMKDLVIKSIKVNECKN